MADLDRALAERAASAENVGERTRPLADIIREAWAAGQAFDLSDVYYGPTHWESREGFYKAPFPYYAFLAGFVRSQDCRRIFEIGTHYGGSSLSMLRGVANGNEAKLVTVDITDLSPQLRSQTGVTKLVGDANQEAVIKQAILSMGSEPIDLLYIDADHRFVPTIVNLGLYGLLLRPRYVIIDDIVLNPEMRAMWNIARATYSAEAIDCVDVIPEIRAKSCGFGLIRLR